MGMAIKAIILDFDGVILESVQAKTRAFGELFSKYTNQVQPIIDYHLQNNGVSRFLKFKYIWEQILKKEYNDAVRDMLGAEFSRITTDEVGKCPFVKGALGFLKAMSQRFPLYVASAVPDEDLNKIIDKKGIRGYLTKVYGFPPTTKAEAIKDVLARESISPGEAVYIGDSLEDLKAARERGVVFVARKNEEDFTGHADQVFADMDAIAEYLKRLGRVL